MGRARRTDVKKKKKSQLVSVKSMGRTRHYVRKCEKLGEDLKKRAKTFSNFFAFTLFSLDCRTIEVFSSLRKKKILFLVSQGAEIH